MPRVLLQVVVCAFFRSWQNSGRGPGLGRLFVTGSEFIDKKAKRTVNGEKLRRPPSPPSPTDLGKKLRSRASRTAGQWAQAFTYCTHTKQIRWERERDIIPTKGFSFNNRPTSPIIELPPPEKKKKRTLKSSSRKHHPTPEGHEPNIHHPKASPIHHGRVYWPPDAGYPQGKPAAGQDPGDGQRCGGWE